MFEADLNLTLNTGHQTNVLLRRANSSRNLTVLQAGEIRGRGALRVGAWENLASGMLKLIEPRAQLCQGLGAMAEAVFDVVAELGKGLLVIARNEEWVIAKAPAARWRKGNMSFAGAFKQLCAQFGFIAVTNF